LTEWEPTPLAPSPLPRWQRIAYTLRHRAGQVLLVLAAGAALVLGALLLILAATGGP